MARSPRNPKATHIGPMSKRSADVPHYIADRVAFDTPTRITNAGSRGTYSQEEAHRNSALRPGCMDAYRLPSRGLGC